MVFIKLLRTFSFSWILILSCAHAEEILLKKSLSSIASLRTSGFSTSLRSLNSNSVCYEQTSVLESNAQLSRTLEDVMRNVESVFQNVNTIGSFCRFSESDIDDEIILDCVVDYNDFSVEYVSMCAENKGKPYPKSFLTSCQDGNISLQVELMNIPSCLGSSCNSNEINAAMHHFLDLAEASLNERLNVRHNEVQCKFFHHYDMVSQPVAYVLAVGNDGNVQLVKITSPMPTYIWALVSFGGVSLVSLIIYKMRRRRNSKCDKGYSDDLSLQNNNEGTADDFQESSYQKYIHVAKKEVSKLLSTVQIFYEKSKTSYDDVPFDEAIEIEYK